MKYFVINLLSVICLFSITTSAAELSQPAIALCESRLQICLLPANSTILQEGCFNTFNSCMQSNAYVPSPKPLECFRSEAAWDAADYQLYSAITIFIATFLGIPAVMKALAKLVNFAAKVGENGTMRCGCFGKFLLFFTDLNEDGNVNPNELLQPTLTFLGGFSFTTFLSAKVGAIKTQADCDYALSKPVTGS